MDIGEIEVQPTVTETAGSQFELPCSVDIASEPLPENVPSPTFEWFFGNPSSNSLPGGINVSNVTKNGSVYTSVLHFPSLLVSHNGTYTCRLGGSGRLEATTIVTVNCEYNLHDLYFNKNLLTFK